MGLFESSSSSSLSQSTIAASRPSRPVRDSAGPRTATTRPLSDLRPGALYLVLFIRPSGLPNDFHWGLYLHKDGERGGTKLHITNLGFCPGNWIADHGVTKGVLKSMALIGLMRISREDPANERVIADIIRQEDAILNNIPEITCRIWVLRACERLRQAGYMSFPSLEALEREAFAFGNLNLQSADRALQPRPLVDSRVCIV